MNKRLIAWLLAALPVAAGAEVKLYGVLKSGLEVSQVDIGDEAGLKTIGANGAAETLSGRSATATDYADFKSFVGFGGSEPLNNDVKAIWAYEQYVPFTGETAPRRETYLGVEGKFGKVRAGRMMTSIKNMRDHDFWEYSATNNTLGMGTYSRTGGFGTMIRYDSPEIGGVRGNVAYVPRDNVNPADKYAHESAARDAYHAGVDFAAQEWFVRYGFAYKNNNAQTLAGERQDGYAHTLHGGYKGKQLYAALGAQYTKGWDSKGAYTDYLSNGLADVYSNGKINPAYQADAAAWGEGLKTTELAATASYKLGNWLPRVSYVHGFAPKTLGGEKLDNLKYNQVIGGFEYGFSKRTALLAQAGWLKAGSGNAKIESVAGLVGMRHAF